MMPREFWSVITILGKHNSSVVLFHEEKHRRLLIKKAFSLALRLPGAKAIRSSLFRKYFDLDYIDALKRSTKILALVFMTTNFQMMKERKSVIGSKFLRERQRKVETGI